MSDDIGERLARIEGRLDGFCERIEVVHDNTDYLRNRVDVLDRESAKSGAVAGGVAAVGLALMIEMVRRKVGI